MSIFLNKYSLLLVILVILVLDLNAACYELLNYIIFVGDTGIIFIVLICAFLLLDTYVYHQIINYGPFPRVAYKVSNT